MSPSETLTPAPGRPTGGAWLLTGLLIVAVLLVASANLNRVAGAPRGQPVPTACMDEYDPDHLPAFARPLWLDGRLETHVLFAPQDADWYRFNAAANGVYTITTSRLSGPIDTYMELYDADYTTLLTWNDDYDRAQQGWASQIVWRAAKAGVLYVRVHDTGNRGACDYRYSIGGYSVPPVQHVRLPLLAHIPTPTPSPTPTSTPTPTPTAPPTPTATPPVNPVEIPLTNAHVPLGVAVHPGAYRAYVTARDSHTLSMLNTLNHFALIKQVNVCAPSTLGGDDFPWGLTVDTSGNRVFVACFHSGEIHIFDAMTLAPQQVIAPTGGPWELTLMTFDPAARRAYAVSHAQNRLLWIDDTGGWGLADSGGLGAWGVAANPTLNRVYLASRDASNVITLDGASGYTAIPAQEITPCGPPGSATYGLAFNSANSKLYVACAPDPQTVNRVSVFAASPAGLTHAADVTVDAGGADAGAGIAVNPGTGHAFIANSAANTVSILSGVTDRRIATVNVGADPFGLAVDPVTGQVIVANRGADSLSVFPDFYAP